MAKKQLKKRLEKILARYAKKILNKYQPYVIGVTGSIGKTSTKKGIASVVAEQKTVRQSSKNFNNEIGLPLTIIGAESGGKSIINWIKVIFRAWRVANFKVDDYPEVLVLEYGVDRPGDMDYLIDIVKPKTVVLTTIGTSHLEYFGSQENIAKEKRKLVQAVPKDGYVILNHDDKLVRESAQLTEASVLTYGFSPGADFQASDLVPSREAAAKDSEDELLSRSGFVLGANFKVQHSGNTVPFYLHHVLGRQQVMSILPSVVVGKLFGYNLLDSTKIIRSYKAPKGRMNLIAGIKNTLIIDDTYNSAPDSALAALKVLNDIQTPGRKIAILADMLELGPETEPGHRQVGDYAAKAADMLITFGPASVFTADAARKQGMPEDKVTVTHDHHKGIEDVLQNELEQYDVILIKGSQGMRMEKVVKMFMAQPQLAEKMLVRQDETWANAPYRGQDLKAEFLAKETQLN